MDKDQSQVEESELSDPSKRVFEEPTAALITESFKKVEKKTTEAPLPANINLNVIRQRRPRLIIDYMVLEDFKSYAGRQIIGKFHSNFTSIVGPNGSGKSNLIESMLFIFGFNASWMRLNRLSQLIHNSSSSTGLGKAAVEVHFKKIQQSFDGKLTDVPGSELWIRRTVSSASISKYYLMGKESTQAEVKQKLRSQGIELGNNRFLILQGEVEQISQMKQKSGDQDKPGLLEYLQEIIGSYQFIAKIEECVKEYSQTEQQKHEKGQLMKMVENQLKGMSKSKEEAVKYVKRQKKIYQLQNVLNQIMIQLTNEDCSQLKAALIQLEKIRDKIVAEERQKLKKQAERIKEIKKNKAEMDEVQRALDKYQQTCNKLQVDDKNITQQVSFKSEDLVKYERKLQDSDKQFSKIITQCEEIRQRLPKTTQILRQRNQKLEKARVELLVYQKPQLRQKIKDCELQISKISIESNTFKNKLEKVKESLSKIKVSKVELEEKVKEFSSKLKENLETKQKIEKARGVAERIIKEKLDRIQEMNKKRQEFRNEMKHIQNELRQNLNESQEQGNVNNMFREIMQQGIPGVVGRLGDLGDVSRQYDEIITSSCFRLDNIVVTDYASAAAVLDYLKRKRIGRTTCIILDKIGEFKNEMNKPYQNLPRSTRLFDVINFKTEQAKLAFYFVLRDTLYCEDSDLGLQYAMKSDHYRRRVVSRNKNKGCYMIYQINGTMSGNAVKKGGFDTKAMIKSNKKNKDDAVLKELENRKRVLNQSIDEITKKIEKEESQLKTARQDLQQMKRELEAIKQSVKQCEEEIKDLTQMIGKAEGKSTTTVNMEKEVESIQIELQRLEKKKSSVEKQLQNLQNEQKKGENQEVNKLREYFKKQKGELSILQKQFQREKAILETAIKRIEDIKDTKKETQRILNKLKQEIEKLKQEQTELEKKVSDIIGRMTNCQERLKQCKKIQQDLRMIMENDDKQVKQSKAKVEKVKRDVEKCQQAYRQKSEQLQLAEIQLEKIRQSYRELSASYSFMEHLDQIQKMVVSNEKSNADPHSSINESLETSMLNSSFDSNLQRPLQMDILLKTQPYNNLPEDQLQSFIIFKDKIIGMIAAESVALRKMEGSNIQIINEFRIKYLHYKERLDQFESVRERQLELKKMIDKLKDERLSMFRQGFGVINSKLKEVYQHLTRGGDAELELIDSLDPFCDGVNFSVRPPKKSWKQVNKLSGGEKTLSSLSLIFALHYYKPTPLYFMDQIDAALDFKNVSIVADYIKKRTKDAQFIIISLRNNMFDLANKLIGVYKTNDKTKVINLEPVKLLHLRDDKTKQNTDANHNRPIS